eukprot:85121-Hanusia_phi.AAC.3
MRAPSMWSFKLDAALTPSHAHPSPLTRALGIERRPGRCSRPAALLRHRDESWKASESRENSIDATPCPPRLGKVNVLHPHALFDLFERDPSHWRRAAEAMKSGAGIEMNLPSCQAPLLS